MLTFDEIGGCTFGHGCLAVLGAREIGEHDNRNVFDVGVGLELIENLDAV